ncbi:MAG: hypothetical protein ACRETL_02115 [Gammaproteobacteria bacterium]
MVHAKATQAFQQVLEGATVKTLGDHLLLALNAAIEAAGTRLVTLRAVEVVAYPEPETVKSKRVLAHA